MKRAIDETRPAEAAEWDAAWFASPTATYFQSRAWFEDWASYSRGEVTPRPVAVRFADGRSVVIPIAHQRRHRGLGARHLLSPAGTYGGWLSPEPLDDEEALVLADWLKAAKAPLWWRPNPLDASTYCLAEAATFADVTHIISLDVDPDSLSARATHGHISAVHKAQRQGLSVRRADSASDWEAYYRVYESSLARWGEHTTSKYGPDLFELLRRRGSPAVELWLATVDGGDIVAGGLCLYAAQHVSYWHAAALAEFFAMRPANLLVHEMVLDARARSLRWFDLNPSHGHEGVRTFKERVGAVAMPSPIIVCGTLSEAILDCAAGMVRKVIHGRA